ncbi:MAG: hypothetical protein CMJ81_23260 [Planctomycetaceae bacterium]|nr:hypothetical protein [Planctomycetaceae bacterium]
MAVLAIHLQLALDVGRIHACNIPVFRYALQRWEPDNYELVVLHRQSLNDEQLELLRSLEVAREDPVSPVNINVRLVALDQPLQQQDQQLLSQVDPPDVSPWMLVRYPAFTNTDRLAFSAPFNTETVQALLDSPLRRVIVERILSGDSAVWVLIESGNQLQDDAAEQVLKRRLQQLEKTLQLPGPIENEIDSLFPTDASASSDDQEYPPIRFELIRVSRKVENERAFVSMLINSEIDLHEFDEPVAIPIFGRARSHFALVGRGINEENIEESCQFLVGACSCEVKSQNPGADLLVRANWESFVADEDYGDESSLQLTGLGSLEIEQPQAELPDEALPAEVTQQEPTHPVEDANGEVQDVPLAKVSNERIYLSTVVILALGLFVVTVGTVLIKYRQTNGPNGPEGRLQ